MLYPFFKALHIVGFVSWFAGIFYIVRLFVYHREAWEMKEEKAAGILKKQYEVMERRLMYIIQTPAMALTLAGGIGMLIIRPGWLQMGWMHLKLGLVVFLIGYHFSCIRQMNKLRHSVTGLSSFGYRLYNELPTLILIAIVTLAVWKSLQGLWLGLVLLLLMGVILFIAARLYKQKRNQHRA